MKDESKEQYFRRRERDERTAAKQAASDIARRIHQELAQEYAHRARNGDAAK